MNETLVDAVFQPMVGTGSIKIKGVGAVENAVASVIDHDGVFHKIIGPRRRIPLRQHRPTIAIQANAIATDGTRSAGTTSARTTRAAGASATADTQAIKHSGVNFINAFFGHPNFCPSASGQHRIGHISSLGYCGLEMAQEKK